MGLRAELARSQAEALDVDDLEAEKIWCWAMLVVRREKNVQTQSLLPLGLSSCTEQSWKF